MSKRAGKITLEPSHPVHSLFSLNCFRLAWSTLQSSEHQNDQTQEQFLPSGNPSHEHLTIIMVHTMYTLIYLTHKLSLNFNCTNIPVHTKLSIVIYMYIQLSICILLFLVYLFFLLSVFLFFTVILLHCLSFWHEFLVCVNIPGNKALSDSD